MIHALQDIVIDESIIGFCRKRKQPEAADQVHVTQQAEQMSLQEVSSDQLIDGTTVRSAAISNDSQLGDLSNIRMEPQAPGQKRARGVNKPELLRASQPQ